MTRARSASTSVPPRNGLRVLLTAVVILCGCATSRPGAAAEKITFDLAGLNPDGLAGPRDGLRAVSYEFCIPHTEIHRAEIRAIDPTVQFQAASPGRIGCRPDQCLCIGTTHQPGFRRVLRNLAERPYIERIDRCFFE